MNAKPSVELVQGSQKPNIRFKGRLLYNETSTPEKRVEGLPRTSQTIYFIFSPLLFYGVEKLLEFINDDSTVIAFEYSPALYRFTLENADDRLLSKIPYYCIKDFCCKQFFNDLQFMKYRKIIPVKLNHGYMLYRKEYDNFLRDSESLLQSFWKNRMTTIHMGRLWCRNILLNLPLLLDSNNLAFLKTDNPVIIAGAGESLEYSIAFLKEHRKDFFLAAADTAITTLLENEIKPDLVIVVESQHANLYDFYNSQALSLPAAFDLTSSPELIRKYRGKKYFFVSEFQKSGIFKLLGQRNLLPSVIPPLGSVGISALYIALQLTDKNILYTGLDFSFIPEKYHSAGSPTYILNMIKENRTRKPGFFNSAYNGHRKQVNDKSGRFVYTDLVMRSYLDSLNTIVSINSRIYDLGKVGLQGISMQIPEEATAAEILNAPSEGSFKEQLSSPPKNNFNRDDIRNFLADELTSIDEAISSVVEFQNCRDDDSVLPDTISSKLLSLDYTWLFFPDTARLPSSSPSFLKRFLFSASWFRNHILNALSYL